MQVSLMSIFLETYFTCPVVFSVPSLLHLQQRLFYMIFYCDFRVYELPTEMQSAVARSFVAAVDGVQMPMSGWPRNILSDLRKKLEGQSLAFYCEVS